MLKKILVSLLLVFFIVSPALAKAEDAYLAGVADELRDLVNRFDAPSGSGDLKGPLNFSVILEQNAKSAVLKNFKDVINNFDPEYTADIQLPKDAAGFIAQASADWMVTRALLYGFTGLGEAKSIIESWASFDDKGRITHIAEGSPAWFIAKSSQVALRAMNATKHETGLGLGSETEIGGKKTMIPAEAADQIRGLMKTSRFAAGLEGVSGIQAGDSVYDRSLVIAKLVWCVVFVVQIVWTAYKILIAGESREVVSTIFKGMFIFISLFFIREFAMIGISISTFLGDAILGNTDVAHAVSDISDIVELKQNIVSAPGFIKGWVAELVITISGLIARAVVYVMFILSDVMVGITVVIGPWMIVLSMLPFCESWVSHWVKSFITFLFYRPLACLLCVVLYIVGLTGMDVGLVELMITCIVFVIAAVKVPSMAENMGGAATAVGAGMTGMLGRGMKAGASVGAHAVGAGAVAVGARALGALKDKATPPREGE